MKSTIISFEVKSKPFRIPICPLLYPWLVIFGAIPTYG